MFILCGPACMRGPFILFILRGRAKHEKVHCIVKKWDDCIARIPGDGSKVICCFMSKQKAAARERLPEMVKQY